MAKETLSFSPLDAPEGSEKPSNASRKKSQDQERLTGFSRAYEELEKIVATFESGDIDLERDLPKFERGLKLAAACRERLKDIENHIRKIERTFHVEAEPSRKDEEE